MKTVIIGLMLSFGAHAATSVDADTMYAKEERTLRTLFRQLIFIRQQLKDLVQIKI